VKFIRHKWFLGGLLIAGFIFVTCYCFLENPLLEENTASLIGVRHPFLFLIWNILTGAAFFFNIMAMYETYRCPYRVGKGAAWTALLMLPVMYIFQGNLVDGEVVFTSAVKAVHWVAAIVYMVSIAASMGLLFFHARRQVRRFTVLFALVAASAIGMLAIFLTLGKSGLFEAVPVWMVYIILFLVNCTSLFTQPQLLAPLQKEKG